MAMVRAKVTIKGTRALVQNHFGIDAISLENKKERGLLETIQKSGRKAE